MKRLLLIFIFIVGGLSIYHCLWILDPVIAPLYDLLTQQKSISTKEQIIRAYELLPRITFAEMLNTDFGKYYGDRKLPPHPPRLFLRIEWFVRYRYVLGNTRLLGFLCKDSSYYYSLKTQYLALDPKILLKLHLISEKLGDRKWFSINSGYRTPRYNEQIEDAKSGSFHLYGNAVDVSFKGKDKRKIKDIIEQIDSTHPERCGGFGDYGSFLHMDTRGKQSRWIGRIADRILVEKAPRRLTVLREGTPLKTYKIALGRNPIGPKECKGDSRTPEGIYIIIGRNGNSRFHKALRISYPNSADIASSYRRRISPGGDIMIHGLPNGFEWLGEFHHKRDWTNGCIAVTNSQIDEIWNLVPNGTPIEIRP